jgi:hypothetical protein
VLEELGFKLRQTAINAFEFSLLLLPVSPMFPPEVEGQATKGMTRLITGSDGESRVQDGFLQSLTKPLHSMVLGLLPEPVGEINAGGGASRSTSSGTLSR